MQNYETETSANFQQPPAENRITENIMQPASPDNPPWNNWIAIGTWISSIIFIIVFPNLFLLPYLLKQPFDFSNQEAVKNFVLTDPTAAFLQVIAVIPAHILTLILAWIVVTKAKKYPFRQILGWEWNGFKIWQAFAIVVGFLILGMITQYIFGESDNDFQKMLRSSRYIAFPVAFMATFTAPLVEEVIYRGILYSSLQRKLGAIYAVIVVTLLFGLIHVPQYSNNFIPDFATLTPLFLLSLTLTLIRVRTKNLLPCIVLHTIFNGVGSLLLILQPYINKHADQTAEQAASILRLIN